MKLLLHCVRPLKSSVLTQSQIHGKKRKKSWIKCLPAIHSTTFRVNYSGNFFRVLHFPGQQIEFTSTRKTCQICNKAWQLQTMNLGQYFIRNWGQPAAYINLIVLLKPNKKEFNRDGFSKAPSRYSLYFKHISLL